VVTDNKLDLKVSPLLDTCILPRSTKKKRERTKGCEGWEKGDCYRIIIVQEWTLDSHSRTIPRRKEISDCFSMLVVMFCTHTQTHTHTYIYIERERERSKVILSWQIHVWHPSHKVSKLNTESSSSPNNKILKENVGQIFSLVLNYLYPSL
jgi:hypothetical protein